MPPLTAVVALADRMCQALNQKQFTRGIDTATPPLLAALGIDRGCVSDIAEAMYAHLHGERTRTGRLRAPLPSSLKQRLRSTAALREARPKR